VQSGTRAQTELFSGTTDNNKLVTRGISADAFYEVCFDFEAKIGHGSKAKGVIEK
jgi:hypothetical protein